MPLVLIGGCGGEAGSVASTPVPTASSSSSSPATVATTPSSVNYDTAEYRRSGAAAQAQALTAYSAGATGRGVVVGIIDSGVDANSSEFAGRISSLSADFAGSRGIQDIGGHGTAVADVLLGARNDSGIAGVAFEATLLALRTDTAGSCSSVKSGGDGGCSHNDDAIAAALDAAVSAHARVVNISLGGTPANPRLRAAVDRATAAGTVIVISAGNDGVKYPLVAGNPDALAQIANESIARGLVIVAGAVGSDGALAAFSNRAGNSQTHYLAALGVEVRSIDQTGTAYLFSGTSFSAPTIAGAAALLAQAFPTLTGDQIVALLYKSATDRGDAGVDATYGNGELNIARAFQPQGQTALAASKVPVSLVDNATLGSAMGDAGHGSLNAVITDGYGRDFDVDLGATVRRTAAARALSSGLALNGRTLAAVTGRTSIALSIADSAQPQRLLLGRGEAERARVLAGAVAIAVTRDLQLGIGAGRGAEGLTPSRNGDTPAFLIGDRSLDHEPVGAFALRQRLGGIGLTVAAETGEMRLWQAGETGPRSDGVRRYPYATLAAGVDGRLGPLMLSGRVTRMDERATVLGGRLGPALGGSGAVSWFGDLDAGVTSGSWRLGARVRRGWTRLGASAVRDDSLLTTQALSADVRRNGLWGAGDSLSIRYSEPLRVTQGAVALLYSGPLSLAPTGHERDWEAVYARPLGRGVLTANTYWRRQAGNIARAPDDVGAAVRYSFDF